MSVKSTLANRYRALLPSFVREPAWHATRAAWAALVLGNTSEARRRYAEYLVARAQYQRTVKLDEGFVLDVDLRDEGVGRAIFVERGYERSETDFLKTKLRTGMSVVDIGANLGYYTVLASRIVGNSGRVLAIEPDAHNFALLDHNIRCNGLTNVTAINAALGPSKGTTKLHCSANNFGDHRAYASDEDRESVEVTVLTLDDILTQHEIEQVDLLKMDVQGYEESVVHGMRESLDYGRMRGILMEYWPHGIRCAGGDPDRLSMLFEQAGYSFSVLKCQEGPTSCPRKGLNAHLPIFDPEEPDGCFVNLWLEKEGINESE